MLPFVKYVKADYVANWHHEVLCQYLDSFASGFIKRLMVFMPPQVGKSELVSRKLAAFILGRNPDTKIVAASHGASLAESMNRDLQRTIDSPEYQRLFPETQLNGSNVRSVAGGYLRNSEIFEVVGRRGQYKCAGVGGSLTGTPGDIGIIDDPFKDYADARSKTIRDGVWEWYTSVFEARTHKNSGLLLMHTRWHEDDLAGRLLAKEGDAWTVLSFPAICIDPDAPNEQRQKGEALWPERFDLELLENRRAKNPHQFQALYQQDPRPREGGMFPREKFGDPLPASPAVVADRVRYWDKAGADEGKGDYTVGVLMCKTMDGRYLVEDVQRFQLRAHDRNIRMVQTAESDRQKYGRVRTFIESPPGLAKEATDTVIKLMAGYNVTADPVKKDKIERAEPFASQVQAGNVGYVKGAWDTEAYFYEMESVPNGVNDDQMDGSSGAFNKLAKPTNEFFFTT